MDNAEEVLHYLDEFTKRKSKSIPPELDEYLAYVARTGDSVFQWSSVKSLFKEKLVNVINDFYETTPGIDIPPYPNVDPFNYDTMKNSLLERLDSFTAAPFTVQRICELLVYPRKQYNRIDKFMRAIEKNILVVSTREPGLQRPIELENGDPLEPIVNGSDNNSDASVDVEMEDMSYKESRDKSRDEPQPSSSDVHISVDDVETRLQSNEDNISETHMKNNTEYESVTPPDMNPVEDQKEESKPDDDDDITKSSSEDLEDSREDSSTDSGSGSNDAETLKMDTVSDQESKPSTSSVMPDLIPRILIDDVEMTEQKISGTVGERSNTNDSEKDAIKEDNVNVEPESKVPDNDKEIEPQPSIIDSHEKTVTSESSSSEEDSSNSPKSESDCHVNVIQETNPTSQPIPKFEIKSEVEKKVPDVIEDEPEQTDDSLAESKNEDESKIESDNYSITDVKSELPQLTVENTEPEELKEPSETPIHSSVIIERESVTETTNKFDS